MAVGIRGGTLGEQARDVPLLDGANGAEAGDVRAVSARGTEEKEVRSR